MVQSIYTFYSKEITLEQFIMKWFYHNRDPFMVVPYLFKMGGNPHICPRRNWLSNGIDFFQGRNVTQKDRMGKMVYCSFNRLICLRSLKKLMSTLLNY